MNPVFAAPLSWAAGATWVGLAGFLIQLTMIAALGLAVLRLLRHTSAAVRHLAAVTAMAALIAMPLAAAWMPPWRLPLLPASTARRGGRRSAGISQ